MSSEDLSYYRQRVVAERARASDAATPEIAAVHDKLAHLYESLTERLERSDVDQDLDPLPQGTQQQR